jgi:glutathione S-transferase
VHGYDARMLTLVLGDRNLSSWSFRAWIALRQLGLPFEEIRLRLDTPAFHEQILRYSPARRVPVLLDGELAIWDTLAIGEYLDELTDGAAWPREQAKRARARSLAAEMHSGFGALRNAWSFRAAATGLSAPLSAEACQDLARIDAIWSGCRAKPAPAGRWLFGDFSIADAMYAPVVLRCRTYGAMLSTGAREYYENVVADPHVASWIRDAEQEIATDAGADEPALMSGARRPRSPSPSA